jgi:hypothetical protein
MSDNARQTLADWLSDAPGHGKYIIIRASEKVEERDDGELQWTPDRTRVRFVLRDHKHYSTHDLAVEMFCGIEYGELSQFVAEEARLAVECLMRE